MNKARGRFFLASYALVSLAALAPAQTSAPTTAQTPPHTLPAENTTGDPAAMKSFQDHLAALKPLKSLDEKFVCQKSLDAIDTPLINAGRLLLGKDAKNRVAQRLSTQEPYVSETILVDGKVYARSQHEKSWNSSSQAAKPGLTAVMVIAGGWAVGESGRLEDYFIARRSAETEKLPRPPIDGTPPATPINYDLFELIPKNKDLAVSVRRVKLGFTPATPALTFLAIETPQGDITRYWFYDATPDAPLPPDIFKPTAARAPAETMP